MATSGIVLMLFVAAHAYGNLKFFLGAAQLDHYAEFLRDFSQPVVPRTVALWLLRVGVALAFVVNVHAALA